jgi:hypothetical protein
MKKIKYLGLAIFLSLILATTAQAATFNEPIYKVNNAAISAQPSSPQTVRADIEFTASPNGTNACIQPYSILDNKDLDDGPVSMPLSVVSTTAQFDAANNCYQVTVANTRFVVTGTQTILYPKYVSLQFTPFWCNSKNTTGHCDSYAQGATFANVSNFLEVSDGKQPVVRKIVPNIFALDEMVSVEGSRIGSDYKTKLLIDAATFPLGTQTDINAVKFNLKNLGFTTNGNTAYYLRLSTGNGTSNYAHFNVITDPTLKVVSPNGNESVIGANGMIVMWKTYNIPSTVNLSTIYVKNQATGQISNLRKGVVNDGNEFVATSGLPLGIYKAGITAYVNGVLLTDESDNSFTIDAAPLPGVDVSLVSVNTSVTSGPSSNDDLGTFKIRFKVKAVEDTIYVSSLVSLMGNKGFVFGVNKSGVALTSGAYATITMVDTDSSSDDDLTSVGNYKIDEDEQRTFELVVTAQLPVIGLAGQYSASLNSFKWDTNDTVNLSQTKVLDGTYRTSYIGLNMLQSTASNIASVQASLLQLLGQLKALLAQ